MTKKTKDDGGPAFGYPNYGCTSTPDGMHQPQGCGGPGSVMLRDYFAAKAMQGLIAANQKIALAEEAYEIADAMLAARKESL